MMENGEMKKVMRKAMIKSIALALFAGTGITGWMAGTVFSFSSEDALIAVLSVSVCAWAVILPFVYDNEKAARQVRNLT